MALAAAAFAECATTRVDGRIMVNDDNEEEEGKGEGEKGKESRRNGTVRNKNAGLRPSYEETIEVKSSCIIDHG